MLASLTRNTTTRGLKVVPRCAALTAFTLSRCRPRYVETCDRQRPWLYQWLYERVCGTPSLCRSPGPRSGPARMGVGRTTVCHVEGMRTRQVI